MKTARKSGEASTHIGSSFDDFLEEAGIRNEVEATAIEKILAWQAKFSGQAQIKRQRRDIYQPRAKP